MDKAEIVALILGQQYNRMPYHRAATAYAPTNIALCKYWGKRDQVLNLPVTSSLSISLGDKGTTTTLTIIDSEEDKVILNQKALAKDSVFVKRLVDFLNLFFSQRSIHFLIDTQTNIPTAAGLASSASGFAALVLALDKLFSWALKPHDLSILARLGSGSACRSIWQGFVEWQVGHRLDGMDCYAVPITHTWPDFCIGLLIVSQQEKYLGSREAMQRTVATSVFYSAWSRKVNHDLAIIKRAINQHDFPALGCAAESNATAMHATMLSAWPPILYALPATVSAIRQVWDLRAQGLSLYFTQDAGPNLKLLFLTKDRDTIQREFPTVEIIQPFKR